MTKWKTQEQKAFIFNRLAKVVGTFALSAGLVLGLVEQGQGAVPPPHTKARLAKKPVAKPVQKSTLPKQVRVKERGAAKTKPEVLLFCNNPERITQVGTYAEARLEANRPYRVFYHFRNNTGKTGPLTVAFMDGAGKPVHVLVRKGAGDGQSDPRQAGYNALRRWLSAPTKSYTGKGAVRFSSPLRSLGVASGIVTVQSKTPVKLQIYFGTGKPSQRKVSGAQVVKVNAPRREKQVHLTKISGTQYVRIGQPEPGMSRHLDGTYGLLYRFTVSAPKGSRVRVTFSPRGGHAGLVGSMNGIIHSSPIVAPATVANFATFIVGANPLRFATVPFGGVFYPVEIAFHLK